MGHYCVLVVGEDYEEKMKPFQHIDDKDHPLTEFVDYSEDVELKWNEPITVVFDPKRPIEPKSPVFVDGINQNLETGLMFPRKGDDIIMLHPSVLYETKAVFAKEWFSYDEHNGRFGEWCNPRGQFDYYWVGGRFTGHYKFKDAYLKAIEEDVEYDLSFFSDCYEKEFPKWAIDIEKTVNEGLKEDLPSYDLFHKTLAGRKFPKFDDFVKKYSDIKEARKAYDEHPVIRDMCEVFRWFGAVCEEEFLSKTREQFILESEHQYIMTYAIVKDGIWHERRTLDNYEESEKDWTERFYELFNSIPDSEVLTLLDCYS